jgi:uncharacterized membrane protein
MAVRARPAQPRFARSLELNRLLLSVAGLVVAVMLIVLFVPGVQDSIERYVLSWLASLAG